MRAAWVREYQRGIAQCRLSCPYFAFCGGGHPSNRYFESGRLDGTETDYCRNIKIALMKGAARLAARHETAHPERDHDAGFCALLEAHQRSTEKWDKRPVWDNWNKKLKAPLITGRLGII